jgi:hypothetical protein
MPFPSPGRGGGGAEDRTGGAEDRTGGALPGRAGWRHVPDQMRGPVLAWIATAAVLGGFAVLGAGGPPAGKTTAAGPVRVPAVMPAPVQAAGGEASPGAARRRPHPRGAAVTVTARRAPQPSATVPGAARASATASASASAPGGRRPSSPPSRTPGTGAAVQVRYVVTAVSGAGFQAEVEVVNDGRQPLAGWQITVTLDGDRVTAIQDAAGFVINGILLMQPASSTQVIPPQGGTLRVFFTAAGPPAIPLACTFNGIACQ